MSEKELILAAQKGSQIAYEELVRLHQKTVYHLAFFLCGDEEVAEEIAVAAFSVAWQQISYLDKLNVSFIALVCSLAIGDCEQYVKRQKHRISGVLRLSQQNIAPEVQMFLQQLSAVSFHKRRAFLLNDLCGLSVIEISTMLESPADEIGADIDAVRSTIANPCKSILPLLPDPPKSFTHQVSVKLQSSATGEKPAIPLKGGLGKRFAFGKFTIIAACIALLLLAYSGGLFKGSPSKNDAPENPSQSQSGESGAPEKNPEDGTTGEDAPDTDTNAPADNTDNGTTGDSGAAVLPDSEQSGDNTSDNSGSIVPSGEKYHSIYTAPTGAAQIISLFCSGSFRATLPNGEIAVYYMVPAENLEGTLGEMDAEALPYELHNDPNAIDENSTNILFILYD